MDISWSIADKKKLLMALKQHGTNNIPAVQNLLPHKTITEIRSAFEKYSLLASEKQNQQQKLHSGDSAINQWIKIIKRINNNTTGVVDIVPRVLKYVALFENRPLDHEVNLMDCYMTLSKMSSGLLSKKLNRGSNNFFFENLSNLALKIKKEDNCRKREFARSVKKLNNMYKSKVVKTYNGKKKKVSVILNPLNVPAELLENGNNVRIVEDRIT